MFTYSPYKGTGVNIQSVGLPNFLFPFPRHLDPFGSSVNFLDAAFSNLPKDGILSVTSTDVSAFLGKCPQVTMRHYNGHVIKCEYQPELACRLILASLARCVQVALPLVH